MLGVIRFLETKNSLHSFDYCHDLGSDGVILGFICKKVCSDGEKLDVSFDYRQAEQEIMRSAGLENTPEEIAFGWRKVYIEPRENDYSVMTEFDGGSFYGLYLAVSDRRNAELVLNAAFSCGYSVRLKTKLEPFYCPNQRPVSQSEEQCLEAQNEEQIPELKYSEAKSEELALPSLYRRLGCRDSCVVCQDGVIDRKWIQQMANHKGIWYGREDLWKSELGLQFCRDFNRRCTEILFELESAHFAWIGLLNRNRRGLDN